MGNHVRRTLVIAVSALTAFALLGVAAFEAGSRDARAGDVLSSALLQAVLAPLLLVVLALPVALAREVLGLRLSWPMWSIGFAIAGLLALGFLPTFLGRPVRPYDALLALVLCTAFILLAWRSAGQAHKQRRAARQRDRETAHRAPTEPFYRPAPEIRSSQGTAEEAAPGPVPEGHPPPAPGTAGTQTAVEGALPGLYRNLLQKVGWDEEMARRLIEYERKRNPRAGPQELIETAIWRWESDNR
jgi:hypothetical protein